ncbi:MAG TPA: BTAD domain-containing putative transcriptional regulator [Actinocrinis sp.]|nr:BTAD domain-containing putative transcriptional regulator [Actinocrinis sp.]
MHIKILGTPEVWVGARRQDPQGLGIWLLGSLALHPGQLLSERRLIELVWGFQGASMSALRSAVSRLRSTLREHCEDSVAIEHLNHAYRLRCLDQVRIDATDFRRLIRQADVATLPERLALLNSALKLWRGPVLDGAPDALVHTVEANCLRRDRLKAAAALVAAAVAAGQVAGVVDSLWQVAADDPFDVPTQALLLNTLGTAGLGARLAEAYAVTERRFRDELKVQVPRQLVNAYESATARAAAATGQSEGVPARRAAASSSPGALGLSWLPGFARLAELPGQPSWSTWSGLSDPAAMQRQSTPTTPNATKTTDPPNTPNTPNAANEAGTSAAASTGAVPVCRPPSARTGVSYENMPAYADLRGYLDHESRSTAAGFVLAGPHSRLKTTLAAHAAHAVGEAGTYRVLWATLDASTSTDEVLVRFLRALGVPPQEIPRSTSLHADMLRDCLDQIPAALFLDGVSRRGQVLPFVPGTTRSKLVVLSDLPSSRLSGFAYSHPIRLRRRRQFQRSPIASASSRG